MADLQFDQAESPQGQAGLTCANCGKEISDTYFEVNGKVVCATCRYMVEEAWNKSGGGSKVRFGKALGLGLLAAIGSGVAWYAVMELTDAQWGILAVGVGLAIGAAVNKGAHGRGGWRYQTLAIFLTYTAIVSSYAPYVIQGFKEQATLADSVAVTSPAPEKAVSEKAATEASSPGAGAILVALAALLLLFYSTPILVGIQSPILLFILGIALYEAWKLNRKVELKFTGPYQVRA